ncbi:MAG: SURF1 family protein [Sphingomonadales bacterium]|nr:MAG: SURF1 family protein [Sphingomonadales bacterium]
MKRMLLVGLALIAMLGFLALGVWQVERRGWKLDLIARVEAGRTAPPARDWTTFAEYRRVQLTGTYLYDRETLVKAVTAKGEGYWVMTPLRTAESAGCSVEAPLLPREAVVEGAPPRGPGSRPGPLRQAAPATSPAARGRKADPSRCRPDIVLINRGFVPSAASPRWCGPDVEVRVTGLQRASEPGGGFLRSNDPAADRWFSRDVSAIAAARGIGTVAAFFVDADATPNPGGYPLGGQTVVQFRNNHLVYALTWFGLAGLSAFAAFLLLRKAGRR